MSHCIGENYTGENIANELREKMKRELGLTISVGFSYIKVFAKLGSDLKKPDAVTVIKEETFKNQIWNLPAKDLLFVGPRVGRKLENFGVTTIGRFARCPDSILENMFGINGLRIKAYANGLDDSPVANNSYTPPVKSIGNGMAFLDDLYSNCEAKDMIYRLSLNFSSKLTKINKKAQVVSVTVRDNTLFYKEWQTRLYPTIIPKVISDCAYQLFVANYKWINPIRSITVRVIDLIDDNISIQTDLFNDFGKIEKEETLVKNMDILKSRFGKFAIRPASLLNISKYPEYTS